MTWKFMVIFYGPEEAPEAKELGQKSHKASTRVEDAPSGLVGSSCTPWLVLDAKNSYKYRNAPEINLGTEFRRRKPL